MPECTCISCNSKFFNRSWNAKFCNDCKNALINFENSIIGKEFDEVYFCKKDYYKFENENNSIYRIIKYNLKLHNKIYTIFKDKNKYFTNILKDISKNFGINYNTLHYRINKNNIY